MVQAQLSPMTFEAFLDWYPEGGRRYELIEGVVVEIRPAGPYEDVGGFVGDELSFEIRRRTLPYSIPCTCLPLHLLNQASGPGVWLCPRYRCSQSRTSCPGRTLANSVRHSKWFNDSARRGSCQYKLAGRLRPQVCGVRGHGDCRILDG